MFDERKLKILLAATALLIAAAAGIYFQAEDVPGESFDLIGPNTVDPDEQFDATFVLKGCDPLETRMKVTSEQHDVLVTWNDNTGQNARATVNSLVGWQQYTLQIYRDGAENRTFNWTATTSELVLKCEN